MKFVGRQKFKVENKAISVVCIVKNLFGETATSHSKVYPLISYSDSRELPSFTAGAFGGAQWLQPAQPSLA